MTYLSWRLRILAGAVLAVCGLAGFASAQPPAAPSAPAAPPEESPLLIEPEGPEEAFEAAVLMQRLARPQLAKRYLQQFQNANPDEAMLLKLRDKHGPAVFLQMANNRDLHPESKTLLDQVNAAFRQRGADPQRVDRLINDLSAGPRERAVALLSLRSAGAVVVPQILKRFAGAGDEEKNALISALVQMGQPVIPPLLGALESPNDELRGAAIQALSFLGSREVVPHLWRPAFGPKQPVAVSEAAKSALARLLQPSGSRTAEVSSFGAPAALKRAALTHYRNEHQWPTEEGKPTVTLWAWDAPNQTVAAVEMTPEAASLYRGMLLARDALALAPEDQEAQSLFLGFALANESQQAGWDRPLPSGPGTAFQLALRSGAAIGSDALTQALQNGNVPVAAATLQALGQIATRTQLYGNDAERSPILAALNYPDPRVQFAAAVAVLQLDPDRPFSGSGRVVEILARALNDSGAPAVLVIDPNQQRANDVAGLYQQLKYRGQPITRQTGQEGFKAAALRNDVELVVVQANVTEWDLSQTLANFRADARTASLPIVIYGPEWVEPRIQGLLERTPLCTFVLESQTLDFLRMQLEPFLNGLKSAPLTAEQRAAQASAAAYWLAHVASGRRTNVFELASTEKALSAAIENPETASNAVLALGAIPSITAQRRLEGVAVQQVYETALREQAALQLAFHVQRHGLLLTAEQVREVQAAAPQATDPTLASALASVLGSFQPNPSTIGTQLQQFPVPSPLPAAPEVPATPAVPETPPTP